MDPLTGAGRGWLAGGLAALRFLGGCASGGTTAGTATRTAGTVARPPAEAPPASPTPAPAVSPAASLVTEARTLASGGALVEASSVLERAVRLDPGSAEAWLALARLRHTEGDSESARELALRSLSVAGDEPDTARSARRFLDTLP